jgi:phosphodiesterase/alkaline phosphatase D-like protein
LLGPGQREWFKAALADSKSRWKVCANQVMIMALDVPARSPINPDQWDGYGYERADIMKFIEAQGIKDVTFVTGDIHTYYARSVTQSGRRGVDATDGPPVATEFVAGSITSSGLVETQDQATGLEQLILTNNPHMVYTDQYHKGYAVLEARPDQLSVRYRAPRTIKEATSEVFTLQDFRVPAGSATVERLGGGGGSGR